MDSGGLIRWGGGVLAVDTAAQRLAERHERRRAAGLLPQQLTSERLASSMVSESDVWRWRLLVQAHGWIARSVVAAENFAVAPSTSLGEQWDVLLAEMVGRALQHSGAARPDWTHPQALKDTWVPFATGRRRGWDADLGELGILVDRNDLMVL